MSRYSKILSFLYQNIFVTWYALAADRKLEKALRAEQSVTYSFGKSDNSVGTDAVESSLNLGNVFDYTTAGEKLKELTKEELERKRGIEEKGRSLLLIVTATIALSTGSFVTFIKGLDHIDWKMCVALMFLSFGFIFLIFAAINVLVALNINRYYVTSLEQSFVDENTSISFFKDDPEYLVPILYQNIKFNRIINNKRSNHVYAAFVNIRNGVILIASFFLLIVFSRLARHAISTEDIDQPGRQIYTPDANKVLEKDRGADSLSSHTPSASPIDSIYCD